jgi:hypothetical protein
MKRPTDKCPTTEVKDYKSTADTPFSLTNFIVYLFCASSLAASIYSHFRQSVLEERFTHFRHLDDRITIVETNLESLRRHFNSRWSGSNDEMGATAERPLVIDDDDDDDEGGGGGGVRSMDLTNVVRKLEMQVAGIQRLKRDVSHMKLTRREQRQASVQPSFASPDSCSCPAGECHLQNPYPTTTRHNLPIQFHV